MPTPPSRRTNDPVCDRLLGGVLHGIVSDAGVEAETGRTMMPKFDQYLMRKLCRERKEDNWRGWKSELMEVFILLLLFPVMPFVFVFLLVRKALGAESDKR